MGAFPFNLLGIATAGTDVGGASAGIGGASIGVGADAGASASAGAGTDVFAKLM
jgi:hypothetical protein